MDYSNAPGTDLVDLFTSDAYRLLHLLVQLQERTLDGRRIRESQEELAELFHVSKGKLNPLMQALVASGCIQKYRARSGYVVTPLGLRADKILSGLDTTARREID
ncbi:hypothetical protein [Curtanaerobium respiraculi]|uniref:hypothetical protein n=1 Tax=Curtanaerobium respiraculi TaxID=2949669 RepID=UPI0024B39E50|nr:hypothetical protein [Curtanaerobium respiraculi]